MSKTFSRFASVLLFIVGAAFVIGSRGISESAYGSNVGPNMFPMGLGIVLMLLCIRLFCESFRYPPEEAGEDGAKPDYRRFFVMLGAALLYALLLQKLGYLLTTFAFLVIGFRVMEKDKWWKTLLVAAAFTYGVYYLFVEVLQGSLPGLPVWFR